MTHGASIIDEAAGSRSHVVSIRGEVDVAVARELERRVRDLALAGKSTIVADISEAEELTPSLLGALIRAQRSLSWRNGRLLLAGTTQSVREQLALVGLPDLFELVEPSQLAPLAETQPEVRGSPGRSPRRQARPRSGRTRRAPQARPTSRPPDPAT